MQNRAVNIMQKELQHFTTTITIDDDNDTVFVEHELQTPFVIADEVTGDTSIAREPMLRPSGVAAEATMTDRIPTENLPIAAELIQGPSGVAAKATMIDRNATENSSAMSEPISGPSGITTPNAAANSCIARPRPALEYDDFAGFKYGYWTEDYRYRVYELINVSARIKTLNITLLQRYNLSKAPYCTNNELYDVRFLVVLIRDIYQAEVEAGNGDISIENFEMHQEYFNFIKGRRI